MAPRILPRSEHTLSRRSIDPDALKVLYRLKSHDFKAYLVGGGVRDLLLGRKPKDFDIGTDANPQQVKRLFRNCFVIGRRFRLCHVRFGRKVIEVSTFRRQAEADEADGLVRRDNAFGTPEEDAFRRDFTVNALFYDIATFSVIDYVGGLEDLDARVIRTIGDPAVRFREDPVRMLRAIALAARLEFTIDRDTVEAMRALRGEIVKSSSARILDEFYKILRAGASRRTFQALHDHGLLAYLLPEADRALARDGAPLLGSLGRLDEHRNAGLATVEQLTNPILLGTLLVPLGVPLRRPAPSRSAPEDGAAAPGPSDDVAGELAVLGEAEEPLAPGPPPPLALPFARRDLDRLRLILVAQRRLAEVHRSPGVRHTLASRPYFDDSVRWLEIHGGLEGQELAAYWRSLDLGDVPAPPFAGAPTETVPAPPSARGRRRHRRRRRRPVEPADR
ncbi:MAG TPA: polynucleotide adenylyltransferase PcnB [Vicinamibacteria bacterium]|nr:polynucleotide adenylyltransferase PcnB [Vicinamibacteria bacterium]